MVSSWGRGICFTCRSSVPTTPTAAATLRPLVATEQGQGGLAGYDLGPLRPAVFGQESRVARGLSVNTFRQDVPAEVAVVARRAGEGVRVAGEDVDADRGQP